MTQAEVLVFDFDGVLADTEPLYWKAWATLLAPHGLSLTWEEYCQHGRGVKDVEMLKSLPHLASQASLVARLQQQLTTRKEMIRNWCQQQSPISQSTVRMLLSLHQFRLGLVTSSERSEVEPLLRHAGIYECFEARVFREDVKRHKPDPAPYLLIRKNLGVETGTAFEDSDAGMRSAAAAGFRAVRIAHPDELPDIVSRTIQTPRLG
jgi:beta-phosphoglucomutase